MSTQEEIAGLGHSNTPKLFKYTLSTKDDVPLTMMYSPEGWEDSELTFIRDRKYKGVLEKYSTDELTFVGDARDYISTAYERGGIDYEVTIVIKLQNNTTFAYQDYFTGKLDFSTYKIDSIGVTCEIINTGFQAVVLNRDNIPVDMMATKFIGGGADSMAPLFGVWDAVTMPSYTAVANGDWNVDGLVRYILEDVKYMPMTLTFSEFGATETQNQVAGTTTKFFNSVGDHTLDIRGTIIMVMTGFIAPVPDAVVRLYKNDVLLQTYIGAESPSQTWTFDIAELGMVLVAGDTLSFRAGTNVVSNGVILFQESNISITESLVDTLPEIDPPMFYIFEAFARTIQLISGEVDPLESTACGRTDSAPVSYGSDGYSSLIAITNGRWIREFSPNLVGLNFTLEKLFDSINAINNIGMGFEFVTDREKVVIEPEKYFFNITDNADFPATDTRKFKVNQILDISGDVTDEIISKDVLPDWYFNEIDSGYNNYDYENFQGLKEFNTKSTYATPIKSVKKKYNIVSPYRMDTQGTVKLRQKPYSTDPTEDVSGDKNIFMFDVKRAGDYVFTVKTDEDFAEIYGGVDPTQSYNFNYTPRRNLERHGNRIRSMGLAIGDEIQWLESDKNISLVTRKTGESEIKPENGDLLVNNFEVGYWIPEAYSVEAPVNEATIAAIQANPYGVIKIGTDKYGWILEVQTNNENKKGDFRLLRVDLNNVKVIV